MTHEQNVQEAVARIKQNLHMYTNSAAVEVYRDELVSFKGMARCEADTIISDAVLQVFFAG